MQEGNQLLHLHQLFQVFCHLLPNLVLKYSHMLQGIGCLVQRLNTKFEIKLSRTSVIILLHNISGDQDSIELITPPSLESDPLSSWPKECHPYSRQQMEKGMIKNRPVGQAICLSRKVARGCYVTLEFIFYQQEVSPLATLITMEAGKLIFIMGSNMLS